MDLSTDGKESMASGTLGQLADFSVMMYLGAKVGDPVMRTTWYGAKSGTFAIGRPVERYVRGMASRYKEAPATGTWVFRKGEPLPDEAATLIDDLIERKVPFDTEGSTLQNRVEATITKRTPTGVRWSDGHSRLTKNSSLSTIGRRNRMPNPLLLRGCQLARVPLL